MQRRPPLMCFLTGSSSLHQAYLPIVAGAERASTLHYCCNDKDFAWGPVSNVYAHRPELRQHAVHVGGPGTRLAPQVLLLDAGCEWKNYASDSTYFNCSALRGEDIDPCVTGSHSHNPSRQRRGVHWRCERDIFTCVEDAKCSSHLIAVLLVWSFD